MKTFKEYITEGSSPLEILYNNMTYILDNGYIKIGRKKYNSFSKGAASRSSKGKSVGISLNGTTSSMKEGGNIDSKFFVFSGNEQDRNIWEGKVKELAEGNYRLGYTRLNSWNSSTGKYEITFTDLDLEDKYSREDPTVIFARWMNDNYGHGGPKLGSVRDKEIYFSWFGSTLSGYPKAIRSFSDDWEVKTISSTSGDGIGDWSGKITNKTKIMEFTKLLIELGIRK